jgi:hypothetical protein
LRTIQVTVTLTGTLPDVWADIGDGALKARVETVAEDAFRRVFAQIEGKTVTTTATVEGGDHE